MLEYASMKNSLLVPIVFIVNFILCLIIFSVFAGLWQFLMFGQENYRFLFYAIMSKAYLFLPLTCIFAIFSVYIFLMRHASKKWLSFLLFILIFAIFFLAIIPFVYSKCYRINSVFNSQAKELTTQPYLVEFIEPPFFITEAKKIFEPILQNIILQFENSYASYVIFAGSFFLVILSFWVCTISSKWKILNFVALPFWTCLVFYSYTYIKNNHLESMVLHYSPFGKFVSSEMFFPFYFTLIAILFFAYTGILLLIRYFMSNRRPYTSKQKKAKRTNGLNPFKLFLPSHKRERSSTRKPRQSRFSKKINNEGFINE